MQEYQASEKMSKVDVQEIPQRYVDIFEYMKEEGHGDIVSIAQGTGQSSGEVQNSLRWLIRNGLVVSVSDSQPLGDRIAGMFNRGRR